MSSKAWHKVMTLSPHKGYMYSVHLLTDEILLANFNETQCKSLSGKDIMQT